MNRSLICFPFSHLNKMLSSFPHLTLGKKRKGCATWSHLTRAAVKVLLLSSVSQWLWKVRQQLHQHRLRVWTPPLPCEETVSKNLSCSSTLFSTCSNFWSITQTGWGPPGSRSITPPSDWRLAAEVDRVSDVALQSPFFSPWRALWRERSSL